MSQLTSFEVSSSPPAGRYPVNGPWIDAVVPGGVHESLLAAGSIGHPFFAGNEQAIAWVEEQTWWYRTRFPSPADLAVGQRVMLRFDCLDTVADLTLNGAMLGTVRNQHHPHSFDVTDLLCDDNELVLRFPPQLAGLLNDGAADAAVEAIRARQHAVRPEADELPRGQLLLPALRSQLRKATFSWGWDFAARVPSLGLVGRVTLAVSQLEQISELHVRTTALNVDARIATLSVSAKASGGDTVRIVVTSPSGQTVEALLPASGDLRTDVSLTDVEVWWTHDLGEQPLYDVEVALVAGGTVVHVVSTRIGIRTIGLDRSTDEVERGRYFRFLLNGVPVFARGANWVPPSLLIGSIPTTTYEQLVDLSRRANMTMLRVWGGGIYEPDAFYDACDRAGLLVWQDFMFACFDYPTAGTDLVEQVVAEATHQVTRLRNHPCLALWCGNNEVQAIHQLTHGSIEPGDWGWSLFHEVLPAVVAEHDPGTTYWPGSPWAEATNEIVNGVTDGDRHAWEVWHGIDVGAGGPTEFASRGEAVHFHRFDHDHGRFISEFGIHASPELATLERWTPPGSLALGSVAFDQRQKDTPKDKGFALMEYETGTPTTLEEYVDFSMACQAEGLKHGIEHFRRRQPHCSGTLVWQLNDSWPGLSWSVIDYDLVPKAGYYFLQRAYHPVLTSFSTTNEGSELWITNSLEHATVVDLVVEICRFDGEVLQRDELSVPVTGSTSAPVWRRVGASAPDTFAWVSSPSGGAPSNRRFFAPLKQLPLTSAPVVARIVTREHGEATVELRAIAYSYLVRVMCSEPGARFSSNYLDLRAGQTHRVQVTDLRPGAGLSVASYGFGACAL